MAKHSKIGASSAHRWFNCPGSVALCADIPSETSEYAEEGTAAHELAEDILLGNHPKPEYNGFEVTPEMLTAVRVYIDTVKAETGPGAIISVEQRFHLDWIDEDLFGTNDACVDVPFGKLTVLDYKHGAGVPVEVEENKQLMYYGLGAMRQAIDPECVEFVIVQPRCPHPDGPVRRWTASIERMQEFEQELLEAVQRTKLNDANLCAGDHCRFCPAKAICPELKKHSMAIAKAEFDDDQVVLPAVETLDDDDLAKILEGRKLIESWLKSVGEYAKDRARHGNAIPRHKLVQTTGNRRWKDEQKVDKLYGEYGDDIYTAPKLKSPAQMEKVIGKELVAELCETPVTGEALVPEKDKRPAISTTSAEEDFN